MRGKEEGLAGKRAERARRVEARAKRHQSESKMRVCSVSFQFLPTITCNLRRRSWAVVDNHIRLAGANPSEDGMGITPHKYGRGNGSNIRIFSFSGRQSPTVRCSAQQLLPVGTQAACSGSPEFASNGSSYRAQAHWKQGRHILGSFSLNCVDRCC